MTRFRSAWSNAQDVYRLPLPTGGTLDTAPLHTLLPLSLRAKIIQQNWNRDYPTPLFVAQIIETTPTLYPPVPVTDGFLRYIVPGNELVIFEQGNHLWLRLLLSKDPRAAYLISWKNWRAFTVDSNPDVEGINLAVIENGRVDGRKPITFM